MPPLAEQALRAKRYHEWGYRWCESGKIEDLTPRQLGMMDLAAHAEQYLKQEQRKRQQHSDRPDHFGDVEASRKSAFQ